MLTQNRIWDIPTVPLGLMNGARGVIVAILYAAPGAGRVDGSRLAGDGYPGSDSGHFPRGLQACPLPEFVAVHFPSYAGPALWDALPRTWVPVPCAEVTQRNSKHQVRAGVPLRLAWALTIHKPQGITTHEGCIVSFDGVHGSSSVSKLGLAFVVWTRATTWAKMAFHKLPRFEDFLSARLTKEFEARSAFESKAGALFTAFLQRRGMTEDSLLLEHERHYKTTVTEREKRVAS